MTMLLEAAGLSKTFPNGVRAVDDVDLHIEPGETLGLVGESGCGKSTTAKLILRLEKADSGTLRFGETDLAAARGGQLRQLRAKLQVVPQHPTTSLNPRLRIRDSLTFNLRAHGWPRNERAARITHLLERVGLAARHADAYPHELSGGQLQRAAIARALATDPQLVICDEAVSALDKSIQAQVLNLIVDLQRDLGMAYLFISHDLAVVEHVSDRVAVMYLGRVVEEAPVSELWNNPLHPYTEALFSAEPGRRRQRIVLKGDPPSPANPPSGCTFRTRCPHAQEACASGRPPLIEVTPGHRVACVLHPAAETTGFAIPTAAPA
jgi:peptide/nickel transport system ATP-binding protein/oligopeptide transport system ATP-binding protein